MSYPLCRVAPVTPPSAVPEAWFSPRRAALASKIINMMQWCDAFELPLDGNAPDPGLPAPGGRFARRPWPVSDVRFILRGWVPITRPGYLVSLSAVLERLVDGVTGLYGNLPPGLGPLLEVSAERVARAFDAWTNGDWNCATPSSPRATPPPVTSSRV